MAGQVTSIAPPGFTVPPPTVSVAPTRPQSLHIGRAARVSAAGLAFAAVLAVVFLGLVRGGGGGLSPERAIAQAINLRPADVPGFAAQPSRHNQAGSEIDSRLKGCVGGWTGKHAGSVDVSSPSFASGTGLQTEGVQSSVTIQRTRALVAGDLAFIRGGRIQACMAQALNGVVIPTSSGVNVAISGARVTPLPIAVTGNEGSFGMHVHMTMAALSIKLPVNLDVLGYAVGRDEVGLMTFATGQTFSAQFERQLSQVLVSRALARPH